jgi:hypothetical protein
VGLLARHAEATSISTFDGSPKRQSRSCSKADDVEHGPSRFDIDTDIDAAVRPGLSSGRRAEHADTARTMAHRQFEDRSPVRVQGLDRHDAS